MSMADAAAAVCPMQGSRKHLQKSLQSIVLPKLVRPLPADAVAMQVDFPQQNHAKICSVQVHDLVPTYRVAYCPMMLGNAY